MHHHNSRPPACSTTVTGHPRRLTGAANMRPSSGKETPATGASTTRTGGGDNLHRCSGADRTRRRGLAGPERPGRVHLDPDNPVATLQLADRPSPHHPRPPPPCHHQEMTLRNTDPPAHPNPMGPKWAQIWAGRPPPATSATAPPHGQRSHRRVEHHRGTRHHRRRATPTPSEEHRRQPPPAGHGGRTRGRAGPPPPAPRGRGPAALAGGGGREEM